VVDAIHRLSECREAVGEVFNIGNHEEITILDLARRVIARTGSRSEIRLVPYEQAYKPGFEDMRRRVPDIRKIKRYVDWEPTTDLDQTIDQIVDYMRNHPG